MRAILVVMSLLSSSALALPVESSLKFGPSGTYSDARVHVFIDADFPHPHCPCFRFSFAVDDAQNGGIRDDKVVLWVVDKANGGEIRGSHVLDLTPVYVHPESPLRSTQTIFRIPFSATAAADMHFQFFTMRRKCNEELRPECREYVPSTQGEFSGRHLSELGPVRIGELFEGR